MEVNIYQVDVFTNQTFGGNPAGIIPDARGLNPVDMQNIAREMNISETVFIIPIDESNYDVRFFTPVSEVDLCGHGTIGAFYTLAYMGYITGPYNGVKRVYQNTKAGRLLVEIFFKNGNVEKVLMEQATPQEIHKKLDLNLLLRCLNIEEKHIGIENDFIGPKIITTGLPDMILPLRKKETLDNLKIDFKGLTSLSKKLDIIGVHVFYLPKKNSKKVYTRNFAPLVGINEEAATGTSNGSLIYFLKKSGYINEKEIIAFQGESLNRPSSIYCKIESAGDNYIVRVGGQAKIILEGIICI